MAIALRGFRRSPDMFIPDRTPQAVGKKTPNTVKKLSPLLY